MSSNNEYCGRKKISHKHVKHIKTKQDKMVMTRVEINNIIYYRDDSVRCIWNSNFDPVGTFDLDISNPIHPIYTYYFYEHPSYLNFVHSFSLQY